MARYSDDDLLKLVGEERKRSIGFGEGDSSELLNARQKALEYRKGEMRDVPSLPGRSGAVDMTIADAVETALPDLLEIFIAGDDVATFNPLDEDDEAKAREETEFVNHVVFTENPGAVFLYSAIKDSLLERLGVLHWWFEDEEREHVTEGLDQDQLGLLMADTEQKKPWATMEQSDGKDGSFDLSCKEMHGRVKVSAVPPDDFSVASDTVILAETTYCVMRDRPRVQDLIARGLDPEKVRGLPHYTIKTDAINQARDESGESRITVGEATGDLRVVEVRAHYLRLAMDDERQLGIWRIITDNEEKVLLDKEEVSHIPFGPLTPYLIAHRLIGESVADKLFEIQRIRTALLRMWLDSGYFALNQRHEVADQGSNEHTIADLIRNEPGVPVRVKNTGTVNAIQPAALGFDPAMALEYTATMAEARTGIVRNAQGLNPDTLHDTAKGAMALMTMAQKRIRLIARMYAEMGIKDMFLGVHRLLRENCTSEFAPLKAKVSKKWMEMRPADWCARDAMTVHVGVGSAGREHDLMVANNRLELMQALVTEQGGMSGPVVDAKNVHAALTDWERAAGSKKADVFWSDPANAQPQPPKPDPAMVKVQSDAQLAHAKAASDAKLAESKAQTDAALTAQKHQNDLEAAAAKGQQDHALAVARLQAEMQLKREQIGAELELKREQLTAELELKRELGLAQAAVAHETGMAKVNASTSQVEPGGEPG